MYQFTDMQFRRLTRSVFKHIVCDKYMTLIKYVRGDLFSAVTTAKPVLLVHACNCLGVWGGGIAAIFKRKYPGSYKLYNEYCKKHSKNPESILGTSLLVPAVQQENVIVVCLFTSVIGQESPHEIAKNTEMAMLDLKNKLQHPEMIGDLHVQEMLKDAIGKELSVNMPKINSGIFGVPWEFTEDALEKADMKCTVYEL